MAVNTRSTNWAGNLTYSAARWHRPESVEQLQAVVAGCRKLRVVGTRHSFNDLADTIEDIVSLERFAPEVTVDRARREVTISANLRYGDVCAQLHQAGLALPNLASLPHISVAGACATGTHGSGDQCGSLATAVKALEMVLADGRLVRLSREADGDEFAAVVVGLGALGVVTRMTLAAVPAYDVRQDVYENLSLDQLEAHFDELLGGAYSVSLFTNWRSERINQVWVKRVANDGDGFEAPLELFGARLASGSLHPIPGVDPINCTEQLGVRGPWHERLPHFRLEFTPSHGEELQAEYVVARHQARAAVRAIAGIRAQAAPLVQTAEVRSVAADDLWLSPFYQQDSVCLHFTLVRDWPAVRALLPVIEAALAPCEPRPHWGKLFTLAPAEVQARYPRLRDFQQRRAHYDPDGKFLNPFLERYLLDPA